MSTREEESRKGKMTVAEAGKRGGERTAQTHGREFYEEIGRKGGEKVSQERGPEFYREIGRKGGEKVAEERGSEFYKEIGRKGGESRGSKIIGTKVARGRRRRAEVGRTKRD